MYLRNVLLQLNDALWWPYMEQDWNKIWCRRIVQAPDQKRGLEMRFRSPNLLTGQNNVFLDRNFVNFSFLAL